MKKVFMIIFSLMLVGAVQARQNCELKNQQVSDTLKFMTEYRQFADYVCNCTTLTKPMADSLMVRQDELMHWYRKIKPQLNDAQVEEYNRLKGRYTKKILEYRGSRLEDGIGATGDSIAKAAGRAGKAIGGFFKGIFER